MIPARLFVACLRLARMGFHQRASEAAAEDRPDYALAMWHAADVMTAGEKWLRNLLKE